MHFPPTVGNARIQELQIELEYLLHVHSHPWGMGMNDETHSALSPET